MKRRLLFIIQIVFWMFVTNPLFSQVYKAVVKSYDPVKSICWNQDGSLIAYTSSEKLYLRNTKNYQLEASLSLQNISSFSFTKNDGKSSVSGVTLSGDYFIWDYNNPEETSIDNLSFTTNFSEENKISQIQISDNGKLIALALENQTFKLYRLNDEKETEIVIEETLDSKISCLNFSKNNSYVLCGTKDGNVRVWKTESEAQSEVLESVYGYLELPSLITNSGTVIASDSPTSLVFYNLDGSKKNRIEAGSRIKSIALSDNQYQLVVLTDDDRLCFYSTMTYSMKGYIATVIDDSILLFSTNSDDSKIIVYFNDGSFYRYTVEDVLLSPTQVTPKLKIPENSVAEDSKQDEKVEKKTDEKSAEKPEEEVVQKKDDKKSTFNDSIYFDLNVGAIPAPDLFTWSIGLGLEYRNTKLIYPFYFGGGYSFDIAFAKSDFPYTYRINGKVTGSPFATMNTIYIPGGFIYSPWIDDFYVIINAKLGLRIISVAILESGAYIKGSPYFLLYASLGISAIYKQFELDLACDFDYVNGFCPEITFGWNLDLDIIMRLFKK